jgi:hypothetical protein
MTEELFDSWKEQEIFLFSRKFSNLSASYKWVLGALRMDVK